MHWRYERKPERLLAFVSLAAALLRPPFVDITAPDLDRRLAIAQGVALDALQSR
ncbi:hypothetical protein J7E89_28640 [Streptomyces sp. ISL-100]|nr:hypothetical protein [Streptomyces sp. ISL-100]